MAGFIFCKRKKGHKGEEAPILRVFLVFSLCTILHDDKAKKKKKGAVASQFLPLE